MFDAQQFVAGQGIWIVLGLIFAGALGLPLPAPPVLIAAGVLAGAGELSLLAVLGGSLLALLVGDLLWFQLGRWQGRRILALLCRISIEPDSCVRKTEDLFARNQTTALLLAKFLPGLKTVAPPLAGMMEMPVLRFALYDGLGALLWIATFTALGYLFSAQVIPSPTAKRARSTRSSDFSLALSARIAFVSASLSARLATDPPHSTLSISTMPPGRTSFRQRS